MAYHLPESATAQPDLSAKNRVWGFFGKSVSANLKTRRPAPEPHRENYVAPRRTASGIPLWPSRDPIGERGGVNLYGFVGNDGVNLWELLGLAEWSEWNYLLESREGWGHVGGGDSRVAPQSEGGPTLMTIGEPGKWGVAVYNGANGPPTEMDCETAQIEFTYKFIRGDNSGFFFSIREGSMGSAEEVKIGGYELQLGTENLHHIGRLKTLQDALERGRSRLTPEAIASLEDRIKVEIKSLPGAIYGLHERISEPGQKKDDAWGDAVMVEADEPGDGSGTKFRAWINGVKVSEFVSEKGRGLGGGPRKFFSVKVTSDFF